MKNLFKVWLLAFVLALGIGEAFGQYVWTKYAGNPVMLSGQGNSWDSRDIFPCCVLFRDSVYHLWYERLGRYGQLEIYPQRLCAFIKRHYVDQAHHTGARRRYSRRMGLL